MTKLITRDPFSGESTGEFELDTFTHANEKVSALHQAQVHWAQVPLSERVKRVQEGLLYFDAHRDQIALDICEQMGRPLQHAKGELKGFFERAHYLCSIAESVLAPDRLESQPGFERAIEHVPLGVIFVISAWNYPLLITVNSIVPGLIAGNTILLKHSSLTPKIAFHFAKAFGQLGSFSPLVSPVIIDHETTGRIIEELPINHVVFTGSVQGGRSILKHTSHRFMTPALELGGKDAAYVHSDADLQYAVETVVDGAMFNAGQSCCGMERVYVHSAIYDEFLIRAEKLIKTYKLGDPKLESTTLGPLAQAKSAQIMEAQISDALNKGANVLTGGRKLVLGKGTFFEATLVSDVSHEMSIMREENFGPILPVMRVENLNEAIHLVNDSEYGLTAAIFTQDKTLAHQFAREVHVGTVFMNRCDYLDPALPWTGAKESGCGSSLSKYGYYGLTRRKAIHFKTET